MWATRAALSAKRKSQNSCLSIFVWACKSPDIKQTAIKTVVDVHSTMIVKVFYNLFKHHTEKDAGQSRCQNTTLFHTIDNGKGSREVAVQSNLAALVFVQLDNHAEELWRADKVLHPQSLSAHWVKRFGQVHKCYIQSFVLLPSFFLELSEDEHHVCGTPVGSEPTLSFW